MPIFLSFICCFLTSTNIKENLTWRDNSMFADQLFNLSNCSPTNVGVTVANREVWALGGNCGFSIISLSFAQIFNPGTLGCVVDAESTYPPQWVCVARVLVIGRRGSRELLLRLLLTCPSRPISYMELANRAAFWHDTFVAVWSCGHF